MLLLLNFLGGKSRGGGAVPLLYNPSAKKLILVGLFNLFICTWSVMSLMFCVYGNSQFGSEVVHYLFSIVLVNGITAAHFFNLARSTYRTDFQWTKDIIFIVALSVLQYGAMLWGSWLTYKLYLSKLTVGTNMYYHFRMGRWMYNSVLTMTVLNAASIIYKTYVLLISMVLNFAAQLRYRECLR